MEWRRAFDRDWRSAGYYRFGLRVEVLKRWLAKLEDRGIDVKAQRDLLEDAPDAKRWDRARWDQQDLVAKWIDQTLAEMGRSSR